MTDQQQCPDLVVPDSVIEQAASEAAVAARRLENRVLGDPFTAAVAAAAPVIAAWARNQERARIKRLVEQRTKEAGDDYLRDPDAYHRGREDELLMVADEIGSADTREDGKP